MGKRFKVQKNGTPCKNPRKKSGVAKRCERAAYITDQKNKKNYCMNLVHAPELERNIGLIKSMAPVVPITDASIVPISKMIVLTPGVPFKEPLIYKYLRRQYITTKAKV